MTWSDKYKRSIDCNNPKGFSQRAHCQGKKKRMEEGVKMTALDKFRKAAAEREKKHAEIEKQSKEKPNLKAAIDRLEKHVTKEDAPVNNVGGGQVAGLGVGAQGEPGVQKKKKTASFISFITRQGKK